MFLSYTGDFVKNFPTTYDFDPAAPVYGPDGQLVLARFDLFDSYEQPVDVLSHTLMESNVFGTHPAHFLYWSGSHSNGRLDTNNCQDWTVNSGFSGRSGSSLTNTSEWLSYSVVVCSNYLLDLCLCVK